MTGRLSVGSQHLRGRHETNDESLFEEHLEKAWKTEIEDPIFLEQQLGVVDIVNLGILVGQERRRHGRQPFYIRSASTDPV